VVEADERRVRTDAYSGTEAHRPAYDRIWVEAGVITELDLTGEIDMRGDESEPTVRSA